MSLLFKSKYSPGQQPFKRWEPHNTSILADTKVIPLFPARMTGQCLEGTGQDKEDENRMLIGCLGTHWI